MRIVVASDQWFPDRPGGSARVAMESAHALAERGHEVTALAPRSPEAPRETREGSLRVLRVLARGPLPQTISDVAQTRKFARRLRGSPFDVMLAHQSTTALGLRLSGLGAPLAFLYHAPAPRELRFLRHRLPFGPRRLATYGLEPALVAFERIAVRSADRVLILSEFSRSLLGTDHRRVAPEAIRLPAGVRTDVFSPGDGRRAARSRLGLEQDIPLLLSVRRLEPRMGLESLLHAFRRLLEDRPLALTIVGSGSLDGKLRRLAAELGVGEHTSFAGRVTDADLPDWYRAADLFVLPTIAYEGFGMVTAEALASGTPVVGTPVGATPELLLPLEPKLVAAGTEPEALAAAIAGALALTGPEFERRCREYASAHFDWQKAIDVWERVLAELA
jgi:glycosyltransferase involved in cell wall biosynthesis